MVNAQQRVILDLILFGRRSMADLVDVLKVDGPLANALVEDLIHKGCVQREGYRQERFCMLSLTPQGREHVSELDEKQLHFADKYSLRDVDIQILQLLRDAGDEVTLGSLVDRSKDQIDSNQFISATIFLVENGFTVERGIYLKRISLSEKGRGVVREYEEWAEALRA